MADDKKKKKKSKSLLRKALDLAISGKKSDKSRSGNVNQNKQLKKADK